MGLLSKLTGSVTPQKKAADDALLLHGMMLMAGADGSIGQEEMAQVEGYFMALPEFEGKNFQDVYNEAVKVLRKFPDSVFCRQVGHAITLRLRVVRLIVEPRSKSRRICSMMLT